MKKIILLMIVILVGCTKSMEPIKIEEATNETTIDCEKFPSATECIDKGETTKPIIIPEVIEQTDPDPIPDPEPEPGPYNICDDYPNHAECLEPLTSFQVYTHESGNDYFDSFIGMKLYIASDQRGFDYVSIYKRLGEKYHQISDKYHNYDGVVNIKTINDNPSNTHYLSKELYNLIKFSIANYDLTEGYFDISIGPASSIWHYYRERCLGYDNLVPYFCSVPKVDELNNVRDYIDIDKIVLNDDEMSITMEEGMSLDLGGVAKGYFVEMLAEEFMKNGLRAFLINAGGNIKTYGNKPQDGFYTIGVQDPTKPRGEAKLPFSLNIPGGYSVVSSGDQIRYYEVDGEIYHHIVNPYNLFPDRHSRQVTIITNDSRAADILSTSVYLMTIEKGIEFVDNLDNVEAIWYGLDNEVYFSKNALDFIVFD
ncbi:FAD:protein FMN transferase [Mycoplasmatota bacterium zrk1]